MSKKILCGLALVLLFSLAVPAFALPPQCTCGYCTLHGSLNCTIVPGNTVVSCGTYYATHCEMPNLVTDAPSQAEFLTSLQPAAPQAPSQACR